MFIFFMLIALVAFVIIFSAHYLLYYALAHFFAIANPAYLIALKTILFIFATSFIVASILISFFSNFLVRLFYFLSATWLGLMLYFFLACLLLYFILFLANFFSFNLNFKILTAIMLVAAALVASYGLWSAANIKIKKLDLNLPNLPPVWQNKTAIWVSDLHLGPINNYGFASKIAKMVNNLKPDLIFIGGDFYDGQKSFDLKGLAQIFSSVEAPQGKFFITGNHEEFGSSSEFVDALSQAGIIILNNKMVELNGLQIIGLDYKTAYDRKNFSDILASLKIDSKLPSILLRHVPDKIDVAASFGISLMLCGHAHGGQLFPIQIIDYFLYDGFQYGLKKSGATVVYTSSGAGSWGPPMRILAAPEIVQINFK